VKAAIVSIGSEILQGFLTDTNSTYLAQELGALGIEVVSISELCAKCCFHQVLAGERRRLLG
jgi:molybdopterin-biosynthesis enzyme MoeA-like protein